MAFLLAIIILEAVLSIRDCRSTSTNDSWMSVLSLEG
jgi:hypothetical protein